MIHTGISFDSQRTEAWLGAIRRQRLLAGFSCHADAFEHADTARVIGTSELPCILLQDITADDTEGVFSLSRGAEKSLHASIFQAMNTACLKASAVNFTLPFRLDREQAKTWEHRKTLILDTAGPSVVADAERLHGPAASPAPKAIPQLPGT